MELIELLVFLWAVDAFVFGGKPAMRYANTAVAVTHLGDYVYDRELPEPDDGIREDDGDHSDEQFDRMDRQNELR